MKEKFNFSLLNTKYEDTYGYFGNIGFDFL